MRVVSMEEFGGPEVLHIAEAPQPHPGWAEVLVRVHAAGVNRADMRQRGGEGPLSFPIILGYDVAGVVAAIGRGVTIFSPGDEVYGMPRFPEQAGGYGEYVTGPSRHFDNKPSSLSFEEAAAMPLSGLTAWQALVETANVRPGQRVLIHGASGAVGVPAVQIARTRGAYVIATAKADAHDALRRLGADELIDYATVRFEDVVDNVDLVVDLVGGEYPARSVSVLRPGGLLISVPGPFDGGVAALAAAAGVRVTDIMVEPDHAGLQHLSDLVERGLLAVKVGAVVPLEAASQAHRLAESRQVDGKIVLSVRG